MVDYGRASCNWEIMGSTLSRGTDV